MNLLCIRSWEINLMKNKVVILLDDECRFCTNWRECLVLLLELEKMSHDLKYRILH